MYLLWKEPHLNTYNAAFINLRNYFTRSVTVLKMMIKNIVISHMQTEGPPDKHVKICASKDFAFFNLIISVQFFFFFYTCGMLQYL